MPSIPARLLHLFILPWLSFSFIICFRDSFVFYHFLWIFVKFKNVKKQEVITRIRTSKINLFTYTCLRAYTQTLFGKLIWKTSIPYVLEFPGKDEIIVELGIISDAILTLPFLPNTRQLCKRKNPVWQSEFLKIKRITFERASQ